MTYQLAGIQRTLSVDPGGRAAGVYDNGAQGDLLCDPDSPVVLQQNSALTAGASVVYAALALLG